MSRINDKLGIQPAGKRAMMKLPRARAAAADLTSATCPTCGQHGVREYLTKGQIRRACSWCGASWPTDAIAAPPPPAPAVHPDGCICDACSARRDPRG